MLENKSSDQVNQLSESHAGRPMVKLTYNGRIKDCFLDTGSSVSLIKSSSLDGQSKTKFCGKNIYSVSGSLIENNGEINLTVELSPQMHFTHNFIIVDLDFPGDILIGFDFLRRFDFELIHSKSLDKCHLILQGNKFKIDHSIVSFQSVKTVCSIKSGNIEGIGKLFSFKSPVLNGHVRRVTVCPPRTGMFVCLSVSASLKDGATLLVESKCDSLLVPKMLVRVSDRIIYVWVVNDTTRSVRLHNGETLVALEEIYCTQYNNSVASLSDQASNLQLLDNVNISHLSGRQHNSLKKVLAEHIDLFAGDKKTVGNIPGITHSIITGNESPSHVHQWRLPQSTKDIIKKTCKEMYEAGVIEPSSSPWLSPVVLVRKKNGDLRFCVDFRAVNKLTIADKFPLPRIEEILDDLGQTTYFTVLDARSAYWSIKMTEEDKPKTAFSDGSQLWQFKRMPYGLKNAPATFQRAMNTILTPVLGKHTLAYLDDIIVFSSTFDEHMINLKETLNLLSGAGLKLNLEKCNFCVRKIKYLGFIISSEGISPDPDKVKAINEMPPPKDVTGVRRLLGAVGFFRRHIKGFSAVASPLTNLTRKGVKFKWTSEHDESFRSLQHLLTTAPVLMRPDFSKPFELHTDASSIAIGACLVQRNEEGLPNAIAYYSRKLHGLEVRYSATDLEALAVVESVRHFNPYLYGRSFTILTDHKPLTYIFSKVTKSPRMTRWSHELSEYSYNIVYKQGSTHNMPDLLSRNVAAIDITTADPENLREYQLQDPLWKELIFYLEGRTIPKQRIPAAVDEFELVDGVLYHLKKLPDKVIHQLVVPKSLHKDALKIAHSSVLSAHPGIFRTFCKLTQLFYFQNMLQRTKEYVKSCVACQRRKGSAQVRAPLSMVESVSEPLERVSADLIDLHSSYKGNRYVLSFIDHMSRYLQLIPLPNKDAETVAKAFMDNFVTLFGIPKMLTTDNGSEFKNRIFSEVCSILKVKMHFTTPFCPQSNGLVERTNRCVKDCLSILCEDAPLSWDDFLPEVRFALNSAFHRAVNNQPIYLFMGHDSSFPVGLSNQITKNEEDSSADHIRRLVKAREVAVEVTARVRESYGRDYNRRIHRPFKIEVGTLVLRKASLGLSGSSRSLSSRWLGPSRVTQKSSPVTFVIKDLDPPYKVHKVHVNQLKVFHTDDDVAVLPNDIDDINPDSSPLLSHVLPRIHPMRTRSQN